MRFNRIEKIDLAPLANCKELSFLGINTEVEVEWEGEKIKEEIIPKGMEYYKEKIIEKWKESKK